MGMIGRNLPFQAVLGDPAIRFDMTQFGWIGNPEVTNRVCAQRADTGVQTARDLFDKELLIGGAGAGGALSTIPQLLSRMLGLKLKLIEGYEGPRDVLLAMERKELDGVCMSVTTIENIRPGWLADGHIKLLFNMEPQPLPGSNVPSIFELTRSEEERQMLTLFATGVLFGRPIVMPPQVPKALTATVKTAFEKAMKDPELIAKAKSAGLEIGVVTGDELENTMRALLKTPRPVVERMKQFMQ
jgi:tripartite-type tricarboxylate transporter receptor subunit TctC